MLVKAVPEDIEKYGNAVYRLALDPARSCYPFYGDGIKTKEDFFAEAERAVINETEELLLFIAEGTMEGWIKYFWIPEDRYLQLTGCSVSCGTEQALKELLELLEKHFSGYTLDFGFPGENLSAVTFLQNHGFRRIEEDWNHSLLFEGYRPIPCGQNTERIGKRNFDKFRSVYQADAEAYWNCDRILETMDDWIIFVYNEGSTPVGAVYTRGDEGYYEIYGTEFADGLFRENVFRSLLAASLNACKCRDAKFMTCFCGEREKALMPEFGFRCVGQYVLYRK